MISKKYISTDVFIYLALFILTSTVYIHNLSSGIYGGDSGDFVTAIIAKGVPHPSGYPLYTLLGILFSYVPLAKTFVWKISLVSSLFSSLSVVVMYLIVKEITKNRIVSVLASVLLAFFYPFWVYAEVPEIFALHSFFILLISFLSLLYLRVRNTKILYALFFTFGLSLTNNESIILLLLPVALTLFIARDTLVRTRERIVKYFLFFSAGLLPYLYIPLAALHHPAINWEHTMMVPRNWTGR